MELHAHMESAASDCDGLITRDWVEVMNDDERDSNLGDINFHDRIVAYVVNTYSIEFDGVLKVNRLDDGDVRISWREITQEGGRNVEATFCTDDCDLGERSYRDHRAEEMGY